MTERPNDPAGDDLDPTTDLSVGPPTSEEVAEEAPDLTDAQLEAAADAARDDVQAVDVDLEDEDLDAVDAEEGAAGAATPKLGARARAEEEARRRREARERRDAPPERRGRFSRRAPVEEDEHVRAPTRTPFAIDPALRIKDPWSSAFVAATILVFLLIFLYAMAFGKSGAFTTRPTPAPIVSQSPAPAGSPGASGSPGAPASPAASPASAAPSVAPSPSPVPAAT